MGIILSYKDFLKTYKTRSHRIRHLENYKRLFPIKTNRKIAGIVADLMSDGNLQGDPKWRFDFTSKSLNELRRFEVEIKHLFNISGKIRRCTSNKYGRTYNYGVNCAPVARALFLLGVPAGQKVLTKFNIPEWIQKDKDCAKRFIQRLFSCEGNVMYEENRKLPQIRLEMWKSENNLKDGENFFNELAHILKKYFNINTTIRFIDRHNVRKDGIVTKPIRIYILAGSVLLFNKHIGFEGEKQNKLDKFLKIKSQNFIKQTHL